MRYGLASGFRSVDPIEIAFHEWAVLWSQMSRQKTLRDALRIALSRPSDAAYALDRESKQLGG